MNLVPAFERSNRDLQVSWHGLWQSQMWPERRARGLRSWDKLTLLFGVWLQVRLPSGEWACVPARREELTVMPGTLIEYLTAG